MTTVEICRWITLPDSERERLHADIDHVFFSSSTTQHFESDAERDAFRERWLGRYFRHFPDRIWIARTGDGRAIGYVAGSIADPARDPVFSDLPFLQQFAEASARFPSHLHVNLAQGWRGQGIGALLVTAFCDHARDAGAPGVHVVTQKGMRNVGFYAANGFSERADVTLGGSQLVFLGRDLVQRT